MLELASQLGAYFDRVRRRIHQRECLVETEAGGQFPRFGSRCRGR
jgi:hypothetical protein